MRLKKNRQRCNTDGSKGDAYMNNHSKYTTDQKERKAFAIFMLVFLLTVITWGILELCGVFDPQAWKPDVVYPMANAKISWEQTYHVGAWEAD